MATALIVVESYFGNTQLIAEAVAAGMIEGGVDTQVVDVSQAPSALPATRSRRSSWRPRTPTRRPPS